VAERLPSNSEALSSNTNTTTTTTKKPHMFPFISKVQGGNSRKMENVLVDPRNWEMESDC
jgi:hypothetical protein